jgi:hypothetical protein
MSEQQRSDEQQPGDDPVRAHGQKMAKKVFQALHGAYGNIAFSRFALGTTNKDGEDHGVVNARDLWANALAPIPVDIVLKAIAKCADKHVEFPPNLMEFRELCRSLVPTKIERPFAGQAPRLGFTPAKREREFESIRSILKRAPTILASSVRGGGDATA